MTQGVEWKGVNSPLAAALKQKDEELKKLALNILEEIRPRLKYGLTTYGVAHVDCEKSPAGLCIHHVKHTEAGVTSYEPCEFCGKKP